MMDFSHIEMNEGFRELWHKEFDKAHVQAAIGELQREARDKALGLAEVSLLTEDDRYKAIALQHEIRGLKRAFDILTEGLKDE